MGYRGIVKNHVIVLDESIALQEGTLVEVTLVKELPSGSPGTLLEVWGSDVPNEAWDAVEKAVEELDRADREYERRKTRASRLSVRHGRV
jgi:hypothetical protein